MALTTLVSAKSEGVTTSALALALAGPRPTLLVEADLSGGSVRSGLLQHDAVLTGHVGLHRLAEADSGRLSEHDSLAPAVSENLRPLDSSDRRFVLPGLVDPRHAGSLAGAWSALAPVLHGLDAQGGYDVVIDAGRLVLEAGRLHPTLSPAALLRQSDMVLLVVRSTPPHSEQASAMVDVLNNELLVSGSSAGLGLLLIDEPGGESTAGVTRALRTQVMAKLPWDERVAAYLRAGGRAPRGLSRTALLRHARTSAHQLHLWAQERRLRSDIARQRAANPPVSGLADRLSSRMGAPRG